MIRQDYILRMIAEFMQVLARINFLKKDEKWSEVEAVVDVESKRLFDANLGALLRTSETEILANIIQGDSTQVVHQKVWLLTSLLYEAGDAAVGQNKIEEGRACYLKGLNLLLGTTGNFGAGEFPEFVPKVEAFVAALKGTPLPIATQARLMQHYEQVGEFGKAEDVLFEMLEEEPNEPQLLEFGISFYKRITGQSDASLAEGNLPREELKAGVEELEQRRAKSAFLKS